MSDKFNVGTNVSCSPFGHGQSGKYKGQSTHCRTEGISVLNVALNMARHGHQVTICGYQWWQNDEDKIKYPLPPNITLQKEIGGKYDVWLDAGWSIPHAEERCSKVDAQIYCHTWGGNPNSSHLDESIANGKTKGKHYMARVSRAFWKEFNDYSYSIYMPTPLVEKIRPVGNYNSNKMLWANRGSWNKDYAARSEKILSWMEKHPDYDYTVLLWGDIKEKAHSFFDKNYADSIVQRFEGLKNKELLEPYTGLSHDKFLEELGKSKISLDSAHPPEHLANLEAVCMGCIPLIWNGAGEHHFQRITQAISIKALPSIQEIDGDCKSIKVNEMFDMDGINGIDRMLNTEGLYQRYFEELSNVTIDHEWENSYKIFMKQLEERR